jgi:septal ring factor EnvC (AmiA/AmiB activator)
MTFAELKKEFQTQEKILENKNQEIINLSKKYEKQEKEIRSLNDSLNQLDQEKRILLHKLTKEIKARIEFEAELILLQKEAEELPF